MKSQPEGRKPASGPIEADPPPHFSESSHLLIVQTHFGMIILVRRCRPFAKALRLRSGQGRPYDTMSLRHRRRRPQRVNVDIGAAVDGSPP